MSRLGPDLWVFVELYPNGVERCHTWAIFLAFFKQKMEKPPPGHYIVAIDGVSGSGKSSTAKTVAARLGILHLDTGAMYRAVTFLALEKGFSPVQTVEIADMVEGLDWHADAKGKLTVDGRDLSGNIRTSAVTAAVSDYARIPEVRHALVPVQRRIGMRQPAVVEGRDMATVVFPDARFKFFMDASPEVRAERRVRELVSMNLPGDYAEVLKNLSERDSKDSGREHSPLVLAPDAEVIDTSGLTFEGQVAIIVDHVLKSLPSLTK
ncbi:MAG: cytidylate kinase [Fibrobacteres bacterium]|nr:cytidylate kinase [Fibrobacterota bacterium]